MSNPTAIPTDDSGKLSLLRHINSVLPGMATQLDINSDQLARLASASAWFAFALDYQTALKNAATAAVAFKQVVREGPVGGGLAVLPLNLTVQPEGAAFEDVFGFLGALIAQIKRHPHYTEAVGQVLNIIPAKSAAVDLSSVQPRLSVNMVQGKPSLSWSKNGLDSLEIEVDRGNGFNLLTIDMSPGHLDTAPLPPTGSAAIWKYRAIYRQKDQRVGQWSSVLEVAVKGS
jgi:hypothetical protein